MEIKVLLFVLLHGLQFSSPAFYECPKPLKAMYLPVDMDGIEDCIGEEVGTKRDGNDSASHKEETERIILSETYTYKCPNNSAAKVLGPKSFSDCVCYEGFIRENEMCTTSINCKGKYQQKHGILKPKSLADCDCKTPYKKDESTGACYLDHCPRAGNYIKKESVKVVHTLADCACVSPFIKNDQSGACTNEFSCPLHSSSKIHGLPKSTEDCVCNFGYVLSGSTCVPEKPSYVCPPHSEPKINETSVKSFEDCECLDAFIKDSTNQKCDMKKKVTHNGKSTNEGDIFKIVDLFVCPEFSIPLTMFPYSMDQCMCLPGFTANSVSNECSWDPKSYKCPEHSYNPHPEIQEVEFSDCQCVVGYQAEAFSSTCKKINTDYQCPQFSVARTYPMENFNDCKCIKPVEADLTMEILGVCPPVENGEFNCPAHSIMNNWPILNVEDCSCSWGYTWGEDSSVSCVLVNETQFTCPNNSVSIVQNPTKIQDCQCKESRLLHPGDNNCRYIIEEVKQEEQGKIVVNGNELAYKVVEDRIMVTQGDIAIGQTFGYTTHETNDGNKSNHHYQLHGYYNHERDHRWKNAIMCYLIDPLLENRGKEIRDNLKHITSSTSFNFRDCGKNCANLGGQCQDYVEFRPTTSGCYSYIGRIGGAQRIGISNECASGNILHVILHAMGLHHTIVRPDRDMHIDIAWECIRSDSRSYFAIEDRLHVDVPYDLYSIMHHPTHAFVDTNKSSCLSIIPKIGDFGSRTDVMSEMGQRSKMSMTDINSVWEIYPHLKTPNTVQHVISTPLEHHRTHVHTKAETKKKPVSTGTISVLFCAVTLVAFMVFTLIEIRNFQKRGKDREDDFSDPLLSDPQYSE